MLRQISLILLCIALLGCHGRGENLSFQQYHAHPKGELRLLSYNVNWGHDEDFKSDPQKTVYAIRKINADILVLQETTPAWEKTFRREFRALYPYQDYRHTDNGGGKAILSKYPILQKFSVPSPFKWYPTQVDWIKTPIGLLQLVNVHLTPSFLPHQVNGIQKITPFEGPNRRCQEISHFISHLKKHDLTIIAGDFNESDKGFALHYLHKIGYQDALSYNWSFYTWHREYGPISVKRRLDHVFYRDNLQAVKVRVLYEGGSDHYPLVVDFDRS